ncbi:unnamed protein product [Blumeria hordei]|uniref:Uncharacterized protein n=1 Tax=Blumeria hordei TaxID=2867405 RepID=A0A383UPQ1_BLUHO|nr:unnamed protein product [Blumeria hordei]
METNNILSHPEGPECQFVVGEGTYALKEDLLLAMPLPCPSEVSVLNSNPLSTNSQPETSGTKVSLLSISSLNMVSQPTIEIFGNLEPLEEKGENQNRIKKYVQNNSGGIQRRRISPTGSVKFSQGVGLSPTSEENTILNTIGKDQGKKKKPKNNIMKSNSSFISRCVVDEHLNKRLQERKSNGYYAFTNIDRAFQWLDLSSPQKAEYLTKILFTKGHCLCHDINQVTKSQTHIDLILGFSTGEIIWYEPISQKYTRLNKNGIINKNPVSEIKWIPGSENLFLASHIDGSLVMYDKEKEEATLLSEEKIRHSTNQFENSEHKIQPSLCINKSIFSKNQKFNPVSSWKLSRQRINSFAFSPDNSRLAVVGEDGTLQILDYLKERLLGVFSSYYGGLICVCWSPDGKYVLTGGQDDLVSIWSIVDFKIVARCQGHHSWVTSVCFDSWRCDDLNYRFGSVGEDCRLLLWDFSVGMLHRPKATNMRLRGSVCSWYPGICRSETNVNNMRSMSINSSADHAENTIDHPAEPRATTALLPPVVSKLIHKDPLCWLGFTKESILTSCRSGHIRIWERPSDLFESIKASV